tara:strand:- start:170 stop:1096 length:927 start_codon:yes stop_codon:yes gene_type:complete
MSRRNKFKNKFLIIMYHQIIRSKKYFNGIELSSFKNQILYFKKNYNILSPSEFYKKLKNKKFEENDCILTFDDGYRSQYKYAYKILNKYNLKGFFFPMVLSSKTTKLHLINKIQLILKLNKNKKHLLRYIKNYVKNEDFKIYLKLKNIIKKIKTNNFYDSKIEIIIKRLLQRDLPLYLRENICNDLFKKTKIDKEIVRRFYISNFELKKMKKDGHEIGAHTLHHPWLSKLNENSQIQEINESVVQLKKMGLIKKNWSFCYPYGDYNRSTLKILKKLNCSAAFKIGNKPSPLKNIKKFELNRLDCNIFQ